MAKVTPENNGAQPPPYSRENYGTINKDKQGDGSATSDNNNGDKKPAKRKMNFIQMLRYSDGLDKFLMIIGVLLAWAQGTGLPIALYFFYSKIINAMISYSPCFDQIRKMMALITTAKQNGTVDRLPPKILTFMNSSAYDEIKNYKSLENGEDYSLFGEVGPLCGYYALIGMCMLICGSAHIACWTIAGQRQIERIRKLLFRAMLSKDAGWFDTRRVGALNNVLFENVRKMEDGMTSKVSTTLGWIGVCITAFIIAFVTDWLVSIVICSLVPLLFGVAFVMIRLVRTYSAKQSTAYGEAGSIASEVFSNSRTVMAFNRQEYEVERYGKHLGESQKMGMIKTISSGVSQGLAFLIISSIAGLAFWWGNNPAVKQAGGNIMQIIICIMMGTTSLANAAPNFEQIAAALSGADEVFAVIDDASRIDNFSEEGRKLDGINGEITFENVSFAYPSRPERTILKSLNLTLKRGQTVALVGPSGCGKSTAAQMLLRFYDAVTGRVAIDGVDIKELNIRWLRRQIGLVSQEPILFNTTIKENIRLGALDRGEVPDEDITAACKLANAHNFISALPEGYDTMVGERGAQLSGGQKQRIAIARALISNPKTLVLDEATSALDTTSEKVVQEALDNARVGRTTLVIAHRLSTIRNADLIAAIDGGVVAEMGNHASLMEKGGLYYRLVRTQEVEQEEQKKKKRTTSMAATAEIEDVDEIKLDDQKAARKRPSLARGKSVLKTLPDGKTIEIDPESGEPTGKKAKGPGRLGLLAAVMNWGRPELHWTIICAFVTAFAAAVQPCFAIVMSEFLGSFCPGDTQDTFGMLIGIIIGLGAFQALMMTIQHLLFSVIAERLTERMRCRLIGKILRMDAGWLDRQENQPSVLTTVLATDCIDIQGLCGVRISVYVTVIVVIGISVIYSLVLEYRVALALMGLMPFIIISTVFYTKMVIGAESKSDDSSNKDQAIIAMDAISNIRTVMALTAEPYFLDRFGKQFAMVKRNAIRTGVASGPLLSFIMSAILWAGAITFCLGSWLMENEGVSFVNIIRVYVLITFSGMSIGRTSSAIPDEDKAEKAVHKLMKILSEKPTIDKEDETYESTAAKQLVANPALAKRGTGRVEFKNVSFSYPTRPGVQVLKDVSFTVEPGQRVALCGPSGGGKSTIIQLVQRLYDPEGGSVEVDGVDIREANIRAVRGNIGLVAQEPVLFALSIGENVAYGTKLAIEKPSDGEVDAACRQANAQEFLSRLPEGLKTEVGERGAQLSGGQKQRIAIARALLRNPAILLLDEATSALDTESERIVQEALDTAAQGRTSLTIAHRLSTIQNSDKILVLANGMVAEQGTHAELMALHGIYYDLQQAQNKPTGGHDAHQQ